jgi:hypothetical protein
VLPAVGDGRLHGPKTKHLHLRISASHNDFQNSKFSRQFRPEETVQKLLSAADIQQPPSHS